MVYLYYAHVCEQARWAHSAGNSTIENLCIIIISYTQLSSHPMECLQELCLIRHSLLSTPLKMVCGCPCGGLIKYKINCHTQSSHPVECLQELHLVSHSLSSTPLRMVCGCPCGGLIKHKINRHTQSSHPVECLQELHLVSHSLSSTPLDGVWLPMRWGNTFIF